MKTFYAETDIRATASEVWHHITDVSGYPAWNRLIEPAEGELREGGILSIKVAGQQRPVNARVLRFVPERELTLETLQPLRLLRPVFSQRLEPLGEGWVRYVCTEQFSGLLAPFLAGALERALGHLYDETCDALRARVSGQGER